MVAGLTELIQTHPHPTPPRTLLFRTRFATLASWLAVLYLVSPELRGGYLIAQRIAPFADNMVYWTGPIVGALLAGLLYTTILNPAAKTREAGS